MLDTLPIVRFLLCPPEDEARLSAQFALELILGGMRLRDFLNLPETQAHLQERWSIQPIAGTVHPCQLEIPHFRELVYWLADEPVMEVA